MMDAVEKPARERVLVAEDDAAQRLGLQQLLKSWGYAVEVASDGRQALEKIAADRPAIVLTDMVMPGLGGMDLLKALKSQDDTDITVVLLTAQGSVETAVEAISTAPKLQKRGMVIMPEYLHIVNGRQKEKTEPKPLLK